MGNALGGYRADVWVSATPSVLATNESCTDSGDHINYTTSVHVFWDDTQPIVVQCSPNGTSGWVTFTDYVFQWPTGKIVFNTARSAGNNNLFVRISSGFYFLATQLDLSYKWALSGKANIVKVTSFGASATPIWESKLATTYDVTGTIDTWRTDDRIYKELGNRLLVQLWVDKPNLVRWQFYAYCTLDIKSDVAAALEQVFTFESEGVVYYLTT